MNKGALLTVTIVITALMLSFIAFPLSASAQGPEFIPGRYIVVLDEGVSPQDVIRGHGVVPDFVYSHALNGFAGPISPKILNDLKQDPRVVHIEQDQKVYAFSQDLPTGIDRIDAEPVSSSSSFSGLVTIAIIDTGIDLDHPDLNVVRSTDCARGGPFGGECKDGGGDDGNGHGTHVAGTVAAEDNNTGVVGVVPGADLWAVKVLGNDGSGWMSWIIGGVDYVTAHATEIEVANMSLGCECSSSALDTAISNSVAEGITYAVAAGNSAKDASTFSPANHDDVITVSAIADFDGHGGGQNDQTITFSICTEYKDDSFACFSNFGDKVEIAAPGVSILSTYKDGGYTTASGTSMASPHVAGAAAKLIAESEQVLTPAQVLSSLLDNAINSGDTDYFVHDDNPDGIEEPLLYVGNTIVGNPPSVSITDPADNSEFHVGVDDDISFTGSASDYEDGDVTSDLVWTSDLDGQIGTGGSFSAILTEGTHTVTASVTDSDGNTGNDSIIVNVVNDAPVVSITDPADGATFGSGASISFAGSASDYEDGDVTSDLVWTSDLDVQIGTGGSFSTTLSDGTHTITASVTDSGGKTGSASITITVGDTPTTATTVSVDSITYDTHGGRDDLKHLDITIALLDDLGNPVSDASVSIELYRDGALVATGTDGITGSDGTVTYSLKNAASGTYTTVVTDVSASGLTWDGVTPENSFDKPSSSNNNSKNQK